MAEIGASRIPDQGGRGRGESAVLRGGVASLDSQRDCQQGVDLAIVEDDRFAGEFLVVWTMQEGDMTLFAAGRYLHQVMREAGAWKFARKTVVLDNRQIDTLLAIPL